MRRWLLVGMGLMALIWMGWFALSGWPSPAEPRRAIYRGSAAGIAAWGTAFTTAGVTVQSLSDPLPTEPMSVLYLDAEALDQLDVAWLRTQYGRNTMIVGVEIPATVLAERLDSVLTGDSLYLPWKAHTMIAARAMKGIRTGWAEEGESLDLRYYADITTLITESQDDYRYKRE